MDFTLTFFDACVIYSICKADLRQKMWSQRLAATRENTPPGVRVVRDLCRGDPSTRPNEVVAAQRVKFVLCRACV